MRLSIILPLHDLRNALERPLASLLNQRLDRNKYEIVVAIPEQDKQLFLERAARVNNFETVGERI
jgi:glycosyltransferase involved in cell wall biosynthesis